MAQEAWIDCEVSRGMFSNERVVEVDTAPNSAFIVPADKIKDQITEGKGQVRAIIVKDNSKQFAILPTNRRDIVPWPSSGCVAS